MSTQPDAWEALRQFTSARIALGRAGQSIPTQANLQFQLDHARARDAVYQEMDTGTLEAALRALRPGPFIVQSQARDRAEYLQRPDLGRLLPEAQWQALRERRPQSNQVQLVVADGLSATAVNAHAIPLLQVLVPALQAAGLETGPICIARQARVALGDDIGEATGAALTLMLIGERPGLSAPDSLGIYLTWAPRRGCVDSERNCISNIRPGGLSFQAATDTCLHLVNGAFRKQLSGVRLKDSALELESRSQSAIPFFR